MAQLRELIVNGPSRFVGASTFNNDVVLNKGATSYADIMPGNTISYSLGSATYRWQNLYITNISLSDTLTTTLGEASTSAKLGDIQVAGGIGIAKNSFFGANIYLGSTTYYVNGSTSKLNALTTVGLITSGGNVVPATTTLTLGTSSARWATIYLKDANATGNIIPNAASNTQSLGSSSNKWNSIYGNTVYFGGTTYYASGTAANLPATTIAGLTVGGNILPSASAAYTLGSSSKRWLTLYVGNGAEGTAANTGALQITGGLSTTKKSFMGDSLTITGDLDLQVDDSDRFLKFTYTGSSAGYDWRIGYLGSGSGNANYLVFQSNSTTANTWTNVMRLGLISHEVTFASDILPDADTANNVGSSSLRWNKVYSMDVIASGKISATSLEVSTNTLLKNVLEVTATSTFSGNTTFTKPVSITNTTASTSKTTGALKVTGGIATQDQMSAKQVMIDDGATIKYDATNEYVYFTFA